MKSLPARVTGVLVAALVAASVLIAGCGQKGPLYLPGDESTQDEETQ
jgi:predicted small lipoprotein YifL